MCMLDKVSEEGETVAADLASLSIWSPNPGVSTIVKDMRVPSSSSSNSPQESTPGNCIDKTYIPTVIGLILTPSSIWALAGSSESLLCSTRLPHNVLTKVVRP